MIARNRRAYGLLAALLVLSLAVWGLCARDTSRVPDEDGIYEIDGYYAQSLGEINEASVRNLARKLSQIQSLCLDGAGEVYVSLIPDKNYQLRHKSGLSVDYDRMAELLQENVSGMTWIGLADALELEDYYRTDVHWRQERLSGVLDALGAAMGFTLPGVPQDWGQTVSAPFLGTYARYREDMPAEDLVWCSSPVTEAARIHRFEEEPGPVYDTDELSGETPYNVFLGGVSPVITVESPDAAPEREDRELIIFGDSFSNSLIPLLLPAYSRVTLVDLRFMAAQLVPDYVDCTGAEVLFLYSLPVANNSYMLK